MQGIAIAVVCSNLELFQENLKTLKDNHIKFVADKMPQGGASTSFIIENGFKIIDAGEELLACTEPLLINIKKESCEDCSEEKIRKEINLFYEGLRNNDSKEGLGYVALSLDGDLSESIVALKMILTTDGYVLTKNIESGFGIWRK